MGVFASSQAAKKLRDARPSDGVRNYFKDGYHLVKINSIKGFKDRKEITCFAVNSTVARTTSGEASMAVGRSVDWMTKSDNDFFWPNIKQFVLALLGTTEDELNALDDAQLEELLEAITSEGQPYAGFMIEANVGTRIAQKGKREGEPYALTSWTAAESKDWSDKQVKSMASA